MAPAVAEPKAEVIVPNFNGQKFLGPCLDSLLNQSYKNFSVTVVDNASRDGSVELVKRGYPRVSLIENEGNAGFAGGCNVALRKGLAGDADFFVLANSDIVADPAWLKELVTAAGADERIGLCQSLILLADEPARINTAGNEAHFLGFGFCGHYREEDRGQFSETVEVPFASGSALLVRRRLLEDIGLLDERLFMYQEDLDLSWRARLAGWRIVLAPRSRAYHNYSFDRNNDKYYFLERNRLLVSLKNYGGRSLLVLAPAFLGAELAMLAWAAAGGWLPQKLRGYVFLAKNAGVLLEERRQVQQRRRAADRLVASFWTDKMAFENLQDSRLARIANPVSTWYWKLARRLI